MSTHTARSAAARWKWPTLLLIAGRLRWLAGRHAQPTAIGRCAVSRPSGTSGHSSTAHCSTRSCTATRRAGTASTACSASCPCRCGCPSMRYRTLHLHRTTSMTRLTDPLDDPESFYWRPEEWQRLSWLSRDAAAGAADAGRPHAGRRRCGASARSCAPRRAPCVAARTGRARRVARAPAVVHPGRVWVKLVCGMPLWIYLLAWWCPANAILLIRSFAEHRARPACAQRIAIVEDSWILGPLFLFNNLHSLHHETPLDSLVPSIRPLRVMRDAADRRERRPGVPHLLRRGAPLPVPAARRARASHGARAGRGCQTSRSGRQIVAGRPRLARPSRSSSA